MTHPSNPQAVDLLPQVIEAVTEAGVMLREEFHRPGGPRGTDDHAPVDKEVETFLKQRLLKLRPCGWLGEETSRVESEQDAVWVVDPNDGTSDFLKGLRGSAVSVALLESGQPVLGVVYAPTAPDDEGDLIAWAKGGSLTRNNRPVARFEASANPVIGLNADAADFAEHNHAAFPGMRVRGLPSPAYRLALAAAGEIDAALSLNSYLAPWDIAGGHALLLGAGKTMVDRRGNPIEYRRNHGFDGCIGGHPEIVASLVRLKPAKGFRNVRGRVQPRQRISDAGLLSRAQGTILGQLAGDALGSAVEFESAPEIAKRHPVGVRKLSDGGTWNLIAGQPTDDSELALALARSLLKNRSFDERAVSTAYVRWKESRPFDIGRTTASAISCLASGQAITADSEANGALMRVSPLGIFAAGDPSRAAALARQDALLTHPNPICLSANAAFVSAIAAGIAGADTPAMFQIAWDHCGNDEAANLVRLRLEKARCEMPEFDRSIGWVLLALQNAFYWLMSGASLEEALVTTVSCGGDTDTNAAICGALLGSQQGREATPLQWRNTILTCRPIRGAGVKHPRDPEYWPDDALELAEALLATGRQDGN